MFVEKSDFETFKFNIRKSIKSKGMKMQVQNQILTANFDLLLFHSKIQFIDPGGASREVWLPEPFYTLDGVPWLKLVNCQNCECGCGHIYKEPFVVNSYFYLFNLADEAEDLAIKSRNLTKNYTTQSVICNSAKGWYHDIPVYVNTTGGDASVICTISQDEGGFVATDGIQWRGFVGKKS